MVIERGMQCSALLLASRTELTGFERLDPVTRMVVLMALLGFVLLAIVLVACVMVGGHWVRSLARHRISTSTNKKPFWRKSSIIALATDSDALSDDTISGDQRMHDTRID